MNPVLRANLRSGGTRLFAAGAAIAVAVAFVVTSLLMVDAFSRTMESQAEAEAAGADLMVEVSGLVDDPEAPASLAEQVQDLDDVGDAQLIRSAFAPAEIGGRDGFLGVSELPEHLPVEFTEGRAAEAADEITVTEQFADAYGLTVGDAVTPEDPATGDAGYPYTVVGLISGIQRAGSAFVSSAGMDAFPEEAFPESIRVVLADTLHGDAGAQRIVQDQILELAPEASVLTHEEIVEAWLEDLSGTSDILVTIGLGFGAIAVFVAGLVITNTFGVLVASRMSTLALLRAVGATARQLKQATLTEGALLGIVGSAVGVVLGYGAAYGLGTAAQALWLEDFASVRLTAVAVVVGLALGTVVTAAASLFPALRAGRTSPMQALRPADVAPAEGGVPRVRTTIGAVLAVLGLGSVAAAAALTSPLLGVAGATLGFLGVLLAARAIVPAVVRALGLLLARITGGEVPRLVAQNARQTPGRLTTTTSALLIGVTLVVTMTVGAATAQRSLDEEQADRYPVDAAVASTDVGAAVDAEDAVTGSATVPGEPAEVTAEDGTEAPAQVVAASTETVAEIARRDDLLPEPGQALLSASFYEGEQPVAQWGETATVTLKAAGEEPLQVQGEMAGWLPPGTVVVSSAAGWDLQEAEGQTWMRFSDTATVDEVMQVSGTLTDVAGEETPVTVEAALSRASISGVIDTVLLVVLILLAASVVVAVIGVSNTLALSVFERRREAALLRALGLSRGGVRRLVSTEAVLMAVVALLLGGGLGVFFGWAGVTSLVAEDVMGVALAVPWGRLGLIAAAALAAAVVASALPARALGRTQPAAGLSQE
ncbi:FtsX-like permease family protein [Nesterenkonia sp. CL21]|uniref:FtsX-like permease family protein n=1 Tax=Nesterenkonia sp. CL21 TaxID=3064894 RepID=UPI00287AFF3A|nr:FtsX-like permease family protein [Nesterenkonia sp. CL21]MDS2173366.1 FtsX-like permease family protein [Nesterenkonia sp. CL21]